MINQIVDVFEQTWETRDVTVVTKLRLPRILASILVGAALAISGATYQALFANPMASPDTLGNLTLFSQPLPQEMQNDSAGGIFFSFKHFIRV